MSWVKAGTVGAAANRGRQIGARVDQLIVRQKWVVWITQISGPSNGKNRMYK